MIVGIVVLDLFLMSTILYGIHQMQYEIDDCYIRVTWFGFTLRKMALKDIEDVHIEFRFWNEHWTNTLGKFVCRRVTIPRKSGFVRNFTIAPQDREAFLANLRARLDATQR